MKYLFLSILLTVGYVAEACQCAFPPKTFITSIQEFTAELEVVESDTLHHIERPVWNPLIIHKLKVTKLFNNSEKVDYVWMENITSTDCQRGLFPDSIGQKYIITGRLYHTKEYKPWLHGKESRTFLHVSTCGKTVLDIVGDQVIGEITKNNDEKIRKNYGRLLKKDEDKAKAYYNDIYRTKHHPELVQFMPVRQFYALMESK